MAKAWDVQLRKNIGHKHDGPVPSGVDAPVEVTGGGRKLFFDDDQQTPDTMTVTFNYPGGQAMIFEMRIWCPYGMEGQDNGIAVYGTAGMVPVGRWGRVRGYKIFDREGNPVKTVEASQVKTESQEAMGDDHARNFIDCVRSRKAPTAEIESGHITGIPKPMPPWRCPRNSCCCRIG